MIEQGQMDEEMDYEEQNYDGQNMDYEGEYQEDSD
jgi:hypothetical protein